VTFSYGNRTNAFLLKHYGFALLRNPYDSLKIKVKADRGGTAEELAQSTRTTEYRFKRNKLNEMVMEWYRIKVLRHAPVQFEFSRTTSPFDSRVEDAIMRHMADLFAEIERRYTTTIAEDEALLETPDLPAWRRFAIYYRLG
jgi:hypothetical protein